MDITELHDEENMLVQMQDRWENYGSLDEIADTHDPFDLAGAPRFELSEKINSLLNHALNEDENLLQDKPVYIFSSHFHEDHFNKAIFEWKNQRENIIYILSKDIYKHRRANKEDADVWLAKGGTWSDETISVWALGSTDSGVSWIIPGRIEGHPEDSRWLRRGDVPH